MLPSLEEIKIRRKKLGLTQQELAKIAGISQSAIAKIENGKMIPNYNLAKRIFDVLEKIECRSEKTAREVMNPHVIYVSGDDSVKKAVELLLKNNISQLPVIEGGKVIGRINERTLLNAGREKKCREIMGLPYPVVNEETPLKVVKEILGREEMVIVMGEEGEMKGVITRSDLIRI